MLEHIEFRDDATVALQKPNQSLDWCFCFLSLKWPSNFHYNIYRSLFSFLVTRTLYSYHWFCLSCYHHHIVELSIRHRDGRTTVGHTHMGSVSKQKQLLKYSDLTAWIFEFQVTRLLCTCAKRRMPLSWMIYEMYVIAHWEHTVTFEIRARERERVKKNTKSFLEQSF